MAGISPRSSGNLAKKSTDIFQVLMSLRRCSKAGVRTYRPVSGIWVDTVTIRQIKRPAELEGAPEELPEEIGTVPMLGEDEAFAQPWPSYIVGVWTIYRETIDLPHKEVYRVGMWYRLRWPRGSIRGCLDVDYTFAWIIYLVHSQRGIFSHLS